jgi:hypothetical protein
MVPIQLSDTFIAIASQRLCAKRDLMTGFAKRSGPNEDTGSLHAQVQAFPRRDRARAVANITLESMRAQGKPVRSPHP